MTTEYSSCLTTTTNFTEVILEYLLNTFHIVNNGFIFPLFCYSVRLRDQHWKKSVSTVLQPCKEQRRSRKRAEAGTMITQCSCTCRHGHKEIQAHLTQSTSDSISMSKQQFVITFKYNGVVNLVTCESENCHLVCFRFVSTWLHSILSFNNKFLNKSAFPVKFTVFYLFFYWLDIPYPDCISAKLTYYRWLSPKTKNNYFPLRINIKFQAGFGIFPYILL